MVRLFKNLSLCLALLFSAAYFVSCSSDSGDGDVTTDDDSSELLSAFSMTYDSQICTATIDQDAKTVTVEGTYNPALITAVSYTIATDAKISPDPAAVTDWANSQNFMVTKGNEWKTYTVLLPDLDTNYGADERTYKSVGYIPSGYWKYADRIETIDWSNLSHVVLSFIQAKADGSITESDNMSTRITDLKTRAAANDFKLMVAINSSSTTNLAFYTAISNATTRATLIANIIDYVRDNDLDGIDVDFEEYSYVSSAAYKSLITELRTAVDALAVELDREVIYSAAVAPNISGYPTDLGSYLDFINLMIYDISAYSAVGGQHSAYTSYTSFLSASASKYGATKDQIIAGMPFYGYSYDALGGGTAAASNAVQYAYWQIFEGYLAKGNSAESLASGSSVGNTFYDGQTDIAKKCQYVVDNAYGGVMIWQICQDLSDSYEKYKLLPIVGETLVTIEGK